MSGKKYSAQTTVGKIRESRGWSKHQYDRFRNAVINEGKELLDGEKYWVRHPKPDKVLWRNLSNSVVQDILAELRAKLVHDNLEQKLPLDDNVLGWKLLPWLRDNQRGKTAISPEPAAWRVRTEALIRDRTTANKSKENNVSTGVLIDGPQPSAVLEAPADESQYQGADECQNEVANADSIPQSRTSIYYDPVQDALMDAESTVEVLGSG
ncbi:hypothetical protein SLS55_010295 [Diplodia seriata]|uniref:Uncharacterized protein n=1 Tax=Diplodia seriata TaxID=420778 RepID=A0ABR3BY46_9PEZI